MVKDYSKGKIYKIVCNITNKIYIGSTCEPTLARRLSGHVQDFKKFKNGKRRNISSFQIIENGDYYIELLEVYPCNINEELLAREKYYINNNECVNKIKNLNQTEEERKEWFKEHYQKNIEKKKGYSREYRENNIDKINAKKKEIINCSCGKSYTYSNKSCHYSSKFHINNI